jgi:hypothetical protein
MSKASALPEAAQEKIGRDVLESVEALARLRVAATKRLLWSPSSRRDLIEIYGYFSRVASDEVAEQLLLEIEAAVERLKTILLSGRLVLRYFPISVPPTPTLSSID